MRDLLATHEATNVREFWIFNGFAATIGRDALEALAGHPDVASVALDEEMTLPEPIEDPGEPLLPGWPLEYVNAPDVWGEYGVRGDGVVVGIMDGGVDVTHPALAESWRGRDGETEKSWFAATGEDYPEPGDGGGHGTHVAGSIVGAPPGEITGVAPEAEWIAAKIFRDNGSTSTSFIHSAFEWMLAPGGDPAAAPDVVNNSWGSDASGTYNTEFWDDVGAWVAAGIVPVFANGNWGKGPETAGSPASFPHAIGVGATDINDLITGFSSRGPVVWDGVEYRKPQLSAPGHGIRSSWPQHLPDGPYNTISGTSMAAPHVTGVVALMLSADPTVSIEEVREILEGTARTKPHMGTVPDSNYGAGIVDAYAAVTRVAHSGTVAGTVSGPDGPVEATVSVGGHTAVSDSETGAYQLDVPEGAHEVAVRAYGYLLHTREVTVAVGEKVALDVDLAVAEDHEVSGTVSGPQGPLAGARVTVEDAPVALTYTDEDGRFAVTLAAGAYPLRVAAAGHSPAILDVVVDGDEDVSVTLDVLDQEGAPGWAQYQNNANRTGFSADPVFAPSLRRSWTADAGSNVIFTSPVLAGGRVFLGSEAGVLSAFDADTGEQLWTFDAGLRLRGAPAVSGDLVYAGGGLDGGIYALAAETGQVEWSVPTPDRDTVYTTPTVVDGVLYAATGPTAGRPDTVFALDAQTGEQLWASDVGREVIGAPAVGEGVVVVGSTADQELVALDAATGERRWTLTRTDDYFLGGASIADGAVYVATTAADGYQGGSMLALDADSGGILWENPTNGNPEASTPAIYDDLVITGSHGLGLISAFDRATGEAIWRYSVPRAGGAVSTSVLVSDDGYVIAGSQVDHRIFALEAATGELVWDEELEDTELTFPNVTSSAAYADGVLVTADARGLVHAFQANGTVRGAVTGPDGPVAATVEVAETGVSVTADGETGEFTLDHIPGDFTLEVSFYGLNPESREVMIGGDRVITVNVELSTAAVGSLTGVVRDDTGQELAGATVTVRRTPLDPAITGDDGGYSFDEVAAGSYQVVADAPGHSAVEKTVTITGGQAAVADFTLERFDIAVVSDYQSMITDSLTDAGWRTERVTFDQIAGNLDSYQAVVLAGESDDPADADLDRFAQIVADADEAGTSLVFLDQWAFAYGSIRSLSLATGDPAQVEQNSQNRGEVWLEELVDHPITASLTGDRVPLLASGADHAWFSEYTGYTLARLGTDRDGQIGDGIGYQRRALDSNHILLPVTAPTPWSNPDDTWLPAMHDLLSDAVDHAVDASYGAVEGVVSDVGGSGSPDPSPPTGR